MKKQIIILGIIALIAGGYYGRAMTNENFYVCQQDTLTREIVYASDDPLFLQILQFQEFLYSHTKPQDFNVFYLWDVNGYQYIDRDVGLITLSDIYPLSGHPDSLAIPDLSDYKKENIEYIKLSSEYRNRFLSKTKISETDSVFVYDYFNDVLLSFPVKNLDVVAYLNAYKRADDCFPGSYNYYRPYNQDDYMIGFEIDRSLLTGLYKHFINTLVCVGKENPFVQGQMKPIVWKKIDSNDFPVAKAEFQFANITKGDVYLYESGEFQYFIHDFVRTNGWISEVRHLLIIDKKNEKRVVERVFYESEGTSLVPLSLEIDWNAEYLYIPQWTGYLFKNKPPVVFYFVDESDSCSHITQIDSTEGDIWISCDNRH